MEPCQTLNTFLNRMVKLHLQFVFFGLGQFSERDLILLQNSDLNLQIKKNIFISGGVVVPSFY